LQCAPAWSLGLIAYQQVDPGPEDIGARNPGRYSKTRLA
jgi:hypothetical protein